MTQFSELSFEQAGSPQLCAAIQSFSQEKRDGLAALALPTRKTESWKYSAKHIGKLESFPALTEAAASYTPAYDLDCYTLILTNGLQHDLKDALPAEATLKTFSELDEAEVAQVKAGISAKADDLPFADLNSAQLQHGLYLSIAANKQLDKPIKVVLQHNGEGMSLPRLFINVGKGAEATLIEEIVVNDAETPFVNSVTDAVIGANGKLTYMRMNLDNGIAKHTGATGVSLNRDARFESHCLALGSTLGRHDLRVELVENGAECDLNAVTVTRDRQHFDHHTSIEHIAPHCNSNENYRCIADNKSQIVFNGRIHIHRDAQKTLGSMSNKNLLLSSEAEIDSKPELEIYADDVKCAHGTTIGQLDETEVYYLKTRGMSDEQARQMLTLGFVLEVVHANPIEAVAEFWEATLSNLLSFQD